MDDYVLKLMRDDVLRRLKYLSSRPSGYIVGCSTYEQVKEHSQIGAALWLGAVDEGIFQESERGVTKGGADAVKGSDNPPAYAMLEYKSRYIPICNLQTLLGSGYVEQLRHSDARFRDKLAVIKQKRNTVQVQLALWKLMGYLEPKE